MKLLGVDLHCNNLLRPCSKLSFLAELRGQLRLGQLGNWKLEQILLLRDFLLGQRDTKLALGRQSKSVETLLSDLADAARNRHSLNRLDIQLTIVTLGDVALLLQLESLVDNHLLTASSSIGLGPSCLSRVVLSLEMSVAFGSAKSEDLRVITDKHHSVTGVNR